MHTLFMSTLSRALSKTDKEMSFALLDSSFQKFKAVGVIFIEIILDLQKCNKVICKSHIIRNTFNNKEKIKR